jgi:hypothetical protein
MGYGPTIAALLVSGAAGGWTEIRELLKRLLIWRVGWGWWAVTLFLNGAIILGALGLYAVLGNELPPFPPLGPGLVLKLWLSRAMRQTAAHPEQPEHELRSTACR